MVIIEVVAEDMRRTFIDGYIYSVADLALAFRRTRSVRRDLGWGGEIPEYERLRPNWPTLLELFLLQEAPALFSEGVNELRKNLGLPILRIPSALVGFTNQGSLRAYSKEVEADLNKHLYHSLILYGAPADRSYLRNTLDRLSFRIKLPHEYEDFRNFSDEMAQYLHLDRI